MRCLLPGIGAAQAKGKDRRVGDPNRRYAYLACAVVAAALPGVDPVSMLLETAPLIALYELSIVLARPFGEPKGDAAR
jgi:Sec-independent protein secretion pathway component TatC